MADQKPTNLEHISATVKKLDDKRQDLTDTIRGIRKFTGPFDKGPAVLVTTDDRLIIMPHHSMKQGGEGFLLTMEHIQWLHGVLTDLLQVKE